MIGLVGAFLGNAEVARLALGEHLELDAQLRQAFNTRDMIFSFGEAVEYISRGLTLVPGDMFSGGTGAGTAIDIVGMLHTTEAASAKWFLKADEVVEVSSPQIGTFRNRIVADTDKEL